MKTQGIIQHIIFLLVSAIMVLPSGCGVPNNSKLLSIESIMEEHPDSALCLLDSINPLPLSETAESSLYHLLISQAKYKNYISIPSDSSISLAVKHFGSFPVDRPRLMRSLYYRSLIRRQLNANNAETDAFKASGLAREINDPLWVARTSDLIAEIYYENYQWDEALPYIDTAIVNYQKAGKRLNHLYALAQKSAILSENHNYNESIQIIDSIANVCGNTYPDSLLMAYCLKISIPTLLYINDILTADENLTKLADYTHLTVLSAKDLSYYAELAIMEGDLLTARKWIEEASSLAKNEEDKENILLIQAHYEEAIGNYKTGFEILHKLLENYISNTNSMRVNSPLKTERDYYGEEASIAKKKVNQMIIIIIGTIIFMIIGITIGIIIHRLKTRLKNSEIINSLNEIHSLREKIKQYEGIINNQNNQLEGYQADSSYHHRFRLLSLLGDHYFQNPDTTKSSQSAINRFAGNEVEYLKHQKTLKSIEDLVNLYDDNLMSKFRAQIHERHENNYQLAIWVFAGLSIRTISLIFNINLQSVSNKISRLRKRIENSNAIDKHLFLEKLKAKQYFLKDLQNIDNNKDTSAHNTDNLTAD